MDLIFTSSSNSAEPHLKYQQQTLRPGGGDGEENRAPPSAGMVVDSLRGPGREFLRSISSVTTSPVSQLPGGGGRAATTPGDDKLSASSSLPKMSKKELKLAQNQLNKLTQINIHLHGKAIESFGNASRTHVTAPCVVWVSEIFCYLAH